MHSRSVSELCCLTQAAILNFCLDDSDLAALGRGEASPAGVLSPAVRDRARLHRAMRDEPRVGRAVSDLLDLRFLDDVILARSSTPEELETRLAAWVAAPDGPRLPGLLWALCTDPRAAVHSKGARLGHEAVVAASRAFSRGAAQDAA